MKVIFFGTPPFAATVLEDLIEKGVEIVAVVSRPDKPKGRSGRPVPTPVKVVAKQYAIPIHQPEKASAQDFADTLASYNADLFVVVAYGEIVKQHILDIPRYGCINLHASLLPKYRGAAPIQQAIIHGETETGVTIMHMVRKMDAGDMIKVAKIPIGPNDIFGDVEAELCRIGSPLLYEVIQDFEKGAVTETPQDDSQVTYAPKIELEDCEVHWSRPAVEIHNLIRGVNPYPKAWCTVFVKGQKKRLKLLSTEVVSDIIGTPGDIIEVNSSGVTVACGTDGLRIKELQLEGKKAMLSDALLRGTALTFVCPT